MKNRISLISLVIAIILMGAIVSCSKEDAGAGGSSGGKGGSMARFTIVGDYIYTVDDAHLKITKITDPANPRYLKTIGLHSWDVETIFAYNDMLFIGSRSSMYIYNIERPEYPEFLSRTMHFNSCDPVVAYGDYAYVTLSRANNTCFRGVDELHVYNISDPRNPFQVRRVLDFLVSPRGMAIDGPAARLFVCDKITSVVVFDISDPQKPLWCDDLTNIEEARGIEAYDAIANGGLLTVIGKDGLYQFDYTEEKLSFVSKIDLR